MITHVIPSGQVAGFEYLTGGITIPYPEVPIELQSHWNTIRGDTPSFHKTLRAKKLLPANPYWSVRQEVIESSMNVVANASNGDVSRSVDNSRCPRSLIPFSLVDGDQINIWLTEAGVDYGALVQSARADLATSYYDLLTSAAEARETLGTFSSLLKRFISLLRQIKSRNREGFLNDMSDLWLQWRYAVRPLISDIQSFTDAVNAKKPKGGVYKHRSGSDFQYDNSVDLLPGQFWQGKMKTRVRISARGTAETMIEPQRFRIAPLTTAWELVTLSFVVDWFFSVGNALASLEAYIELPDMQTSAGHSLQFSIEADMSFIPQGIWTGSGTCRVKVIGYSKHRVPATANLLPGFNLNLDLFKISDLLLILSKLLKN